MQQPSAAPTSTVQAHPQGRVVGNRIYYESNTSELCAWCSSPMCDRRMRIFGVLMVFFLVLAVINLSFGLSTAGLIFLGFFFVILIGAIVYQRRMTGAVPQATTMQTVTYIQAPTVNTTQQVQGYPAAQPYPPQPYPPQAYPHQPHPSQPYPPQQYPTYPSQPYPPQYPQQSYPVQPSYPPTAIPSDQAVSGEKQPVPQVEPQGDAPATSTATGPALPQQGPSIPVATGSSAPPGELPPPPSYSEAVSGSRD